MSDFLNSNNDASSAKNLGTISYNGAYTSYNIWETDSVGAEDTADWFTINTQDLSEVRLDIHPTGLQGDYYYDFKYMIANYYENTTTWVLMYGDNGSLDGKWDSQYQALLDYGYQPYQNNSNYLIQTTTGILGSTQINYAIFDETSFNAEFDPHLTISPDTDNSITIMVDGYIITQEGYRPPEEEISYLIDASPRSSTTATSQTEQYLSQFNITMEQARDFFFAFLLTETKTVFEICLVAGISNDMIAEILVGDIPNLNGETVSLFWDYLGYDGDALDSVDDVTFLGFEELDPIPNPYYKNIDDSDYAQMNWENLNVVAEDYYTQESGFYNFADEGIFAYTSYNVNGSFSSKDGDEFNLVSANFLLDGNDRLSFDIVGYKNGIENSSLTVTLNGLEETAVEFLEFDDVDKIVFETQNLGVLLAIDDIFIA